MLFLSTVAGALFNCIPNCFVIESCRCFSNHVAFGVGVALLTGGEDSKIIQDFLRSQDIDFPICTIIAPELKDSKISICQDVP